MVQLDEATHTYTINGVEVPSVTTVCRFLSYDYKSDRPWLAQVAADRGTRIHAGCAAIDYGDEPEDTQDYAGYFLAYRRFLVDYHPEWEGIEYTSWNEDLGLAGTIDRFGTLNDGKSCILDIKTGELHDAPLRAQLTGYHRLLVLDRGYWADKLYGLQLVKDGTYRLVEKKKDDQLLMACLYLQSATERKKHHGK